MEEKKQKCVSGMALRGYRKDKIFEAVEKCVEAMNELTIAESKIARHNHWDYSAFSTSLFS